MILIMKILLHSEYKIINLWYPTYVYQFLNFPYNYKNRVLACFQTRPKFCLTVGTYISENCSYLLKVLLLIELWKASRSRLDLEFFLKR